MNRLVALLAGGVLVLSGTSCGSSDDSSSQPATDTQPSSTSDRGQPDQLFTSESGLKCGRNLFEMGEHEPGMAEQSVGFVDLDDAAADYWTRGDGRYRSDRDVLTEFIDPPVVRYDNERGETQLILTFAQIDDRWLLDSSEACSSAPAEPPGRLLAVTDRAGAVVSARLLTPDEFPGYETLRVELELRRLAVMQPGDLGFDAVVAYRSTPQCGNLPDVIVDGDQSSLQVSIRTPVSGDCDTVDYDRLIALDLASEYELAPIVVD